MDPGTPLAETIGVFELVAAGSIRAYGGSNVDGAWLEQALGLGSPAWVQNSFSLLDRADETDVLPVIARGAGYTPFSPLAGGWLTGKYRRGQEPPSGSRMTLRPEPYRHLEDERVFDALDAFAAAAHERETTPAALAIRWLLAHPQVTAVVIGPHRPEQLRPALDALELDLSPPEHEQLGALFMSLLAFLGRRSRRAGRWDSTEVRPAGGSGASGVSLRGARLRRAGRKAARHVSVLVLAEQQVRAARCRSASRRWTRSSARSRVESCTSPSGR